MVRQIGYSFVGLVGVIALALGWAWQAVHVPAPLEDATFQCSATPNRGAVTLTTRATTTRATAAGAAVTGTDALASVPTTLKVLSFNVQYMAGKSYVFFYDVEGGPDTQPSNQAIDLTTQRVADIILDEDPDLVLIQEINDAQDSRTHYRDQLQELQALLTHKQGHAHYPCHADAHYWQAPFIPHPNIWGPVSMKLTTLSKHPILSAQRHQLPLAQNDPVSERFYFYRAILETLIRLPSGQTIAALNTHYDAWGEGTDVMQKQVALTQARLQQLDAQGTPWVLGGDLNLLPPDGQQQRRQVMAANSGDYDEHTALKLLYKNYAGVPALSDLNSPAAPQWYTHYPNDPGVTGPDRTIDYLFFSQQWQSLSSSVRQHDTLDVSDHLPVITELQLR